MENIVIAVIVILVVGAAGLYIYRAKKSGQKCIGCPHSKTCSGHCASCSGCGEHKEES